MHDLHEYVRIIAMKAGNHGSYLFLNKAITHYPPFLNKQLVDAIGAGDSFNTGFIYKFINGAPLDNCQEFANLIGAISATGEGGTGAFQVWRMLKELQNLNLTIINFNHKENEFKEKNNEN